MAMRYFLAIETFETHRKNVGGADSQIVDSFIDNLIKKWSVPLESGEGLGFGEPYAYNRTLTQEQESVMGGKPYMLTIEGGNITLYSLDINLEGIGLDPLNPDMVPAGTGKIAKATSGSITDLASGVSWLVVETLGTVTPKSDPIPPSLVPFLLFRRKDIS